MLNYTSKYTHVFPSIKAVRINWWPLLVLERVITLPHIPLETIWRQFVINTDFIQLVCPPTSKLSTEEIQDKSRLSQGITRSNPLWNNNQYANGAPPNAPAYWIKKTPPKYVPRYTSSPLDECGCGSLSWVGGWKEKRNSVSSLRCTDRDQSHWLVVGWAVCVSRLCSKSPEVVGLWPNASTTNSGALYTKCVQFSTVTHDFLRALLVELWHT